MAILLEFRKTGEDERQVQYIYGFPEMDRRLVIDKSSLEGSPAEGTEDRDYAKVLWKILQGQQKPGCRTSRRRWAVPGAPCTARSATIFGSRRIFPTVRRPPTAPGPNVPLTTPHQKPAQAPGYVPETSKQISPGPMKPTSGSGLMIQMFPTSPRTLPTPRALRAVSASPPPRYAR